MVAILDPVQMYSGPQLVVGSCAGQSDRPVDLLRLETFETDTPLRYRAGGVNPVDAKSPLMIAVLQSNGVT